MKGNDRGSVSKGFDMLEYHFEEEEAFEFWFPTPTNPPHPLAQTESV